MIFFEFLLYILLALSVSFVWSFAEIFLPTRNFIAKLPYIRKPLLCPECCSFWIGLLVSFIYNPLFQELHIFSFFFAGLSVHLIASFLYKLYFKI